MQNRGISIILENRLCNVRLLAPFEDLFIKTKNIGII